MEVTRKVERDLLKKPRVETPSVGEGDGNTKGNKTAQMMEREREARGLDTTWTEIQKAVRRGEGESNER